MIVLDEELQGLNLDDSISRWYRGTILIIKDLRPGTVIKDEAIPALLRQVKQPTFVTINHADFWRRVRADEAYCIICLKLSGEQVDEVPDWLRRLFKSPEFKSKKKRMGKVILASRRGLRYYAEKQNLMHILSWPD
ncbi:MAG TPA: hypothetical protein VJX74_18500 [Blastocatellia bacterium]|nr:hypothetical protein [Blastocatellia bacterium]